jgi:hypothetical protein
MHLLQCIQKAQDKSASVNVEYRLAYAQSREGVTELVNTEVNRRRTAMATTHSLRDVIVRIIGVDWGDTHDNAHRYLVIRGQTSNGETQVLIGEKAAYELHSQLTVTLPVDDPVFQP